MTPSTPLRVALADDEPLARERLERLLTELGCVVEGSFRDGLDLLEWLKAGHRPDALFLDIQMPELSGLEILADLKDPPPTVFVTAFSEHAVRAFEMAAADYIVKPVFEDRLQKSLDRLYRHLVLPLEAAKARMLGIAITERIPVKAGEGLVFLELRRISHFEVEENVVFAWSIGRRYRTSWTSIREVEEAFPRRGMVRIQRHMLLRPAAVMGWKSLPGGRGSVRVGEGVNLEVSRTTSPELRRLLGI